MTGSKRRMVPVFGGLTAAAATVGAVAPAVAHVTEAAPEPATGSTGELGLAQDGTFEPCSAYFGFGKSDGVGNVTGFVVTDVSGGDDGTTHTVPDDVQVVLVLENEEGDVIECTPEAVTEAEWDDEMADQWGWVPDVPAFPSYPVFAYPSYTEGADPDKPFIDGFGEPVAVGFRVVGVPDGHTLVSPVSPAGLAPAQVSPDGVQPLPDHFADLAVIFEVPTPPSVAAFLESTVGTAAADAYEDARQACDSGEFDAGTDPDLLAAINALQVLGGNAGDLTEARCSDVIFSAIDPILVLGLQATAAHVEAITLAAPAAPPVQPVPPAPTPQPATPVPATPQFTG